ncbi:apolipoprotein N-acyltransferase [Psychromonas sp. PT13]|uniref:apolipoprotein N-acyltransferase n=1 Tax=Psychromonas sp. PT13 TaxID=3439547 RepID=UPI003EBA9091
MNHSNNGKGFRLTQYFFVQALIAILLGAIQVFAFAPFEQYWTIYPSLIGLFLLLEQVQETTKRRFLISYLFNLSMFIACIHWVYVSMDLFGGMPLFVSVLLIILLAAYLAIFPTLALWVTTRLPEIPNSLRYLFVLPVFWLLSDWLRGWFLTGFPWAYLGYSHADTPLIGFAPLLGVQGVTLAIVMICGALTLIIKRHRIPLNITIIVSLVVTGTLLQKQNYTELQSPVLISLVQGNIDQNKKWQPEELYPSVMKYLDLSKTNHEDQPEIIIWPESAIAALEVDMQRFLLPLSEDLASRNKTLISGIIGYRVQQDEYRNSIITLGKLPAGDEYSMQSKNRYQKHHLLPIGEFVPFEKYLRPLAPYFNLPMSSFQRGQEVQPNLQTLQTSFAAALCYEIAFPELLRKNVREDTGMLLTLSNDAWFGDSIGPAQHLQIARMRAIEFARPLLRSTNNGITAIYGSHGEEIGRLESNTDAVLSKEIAPAFGKTPYQTYGSLPLYLYSILILTWLYIYLVISRRTRNKYSLKKK